MNRQVDVTSVESLRLFHHALKGYGETVQDIVSILQMETQRAVDWFEQDRMSYWPAEVRRAQDRLTEARNQLEMKQLTIDGSDAPSCYEEKKAVESAHQRLRYAEERLQNSKHWLRIVKHDVEEFQGLISKLASLPETDLPKACASLERMSAALEKYTQLSRSRSAESQPFEADPPPPPQERGKE